MRIERTEVCSFEPVASGTSVSQVVKFGFAVVLFSNDVINLMRVKRNAA